MSKQMRQAVWQTFVANLPGHSIFKTHQHATQPSMRVDAEQDETLDTYFSNASADPINPPIRRPTRPLPSQVAEHCTACFEESIFTQVISFLAENLTSGLDVNAPACVPSPQHLALIVTLAVHPMLTTRTHNEDYHAGSGAALKYLMRLVKTVEVKDSGLREALRFEALNARKPDRSRKARIRQSDATGASDDEQHRSSIIRSKYARSKSLWANSEDFWAVVGWAFNCSVRHKPRWVRWKGWLEFMLAAIHSDLEQTYSSGGDLAETLIAQYLSHLGVGRRDKRRIMRAVMADGSSTAFGEIWKDETKPPKKADDDPRPSKRPKLDLENGEFGDYLDHSDDSSRSSRPYRSRSATAFSTKTRRSSPASQAGSDDEKQDEKDSSADDDDTPSTDTDGFGGMESIRLRQKFIAVLTRFSRIATTIGKADSLFMNTEDLFDLFTEFLRPLPLQVFQQFVLPLKPYLTTGLQASLNENLCCPLLGTHTLSDQMTQEHFAVQFAPKCAIKSSVVDNAKLSLLLESLLRALWKRQLLAGDTSNLKRQVEIGIETRNQKISAGGKKSAGKAGNDGEARALLKSSAERMRILLDMVAVGVL